MQCLGSATPRKFIVSGSILPPWTREKKHSNEAGIEPSSSRPARDRSILYAMAPRQQTELNCWQNSTRIIVKRCWWKKSWRKRKFYTTFLAMLCKSGAKVRAPISAHSSTKHLLQFHSLAELKQRIGFSFNLIHGSPMRRPYTGNFWWRKCNL